MSEELSPCPHCCGAVTWCECGECGRVWCAGCAIMTEFSPPDECDTLEKQRAFTAAAWNRRATPPSPSTADKCSKCNGSGVEGYHDHGAALFGEQAIEPIRCEKCDGFGSAPSTASEVGELPPLPDATWWHHQQDGQDVFFNMGFGLYDEVPLFTADQMRAYGQECARAALAAKTAQPSTGEVDVEAERERFYAWCDSQGYDPSKLEGIEVEVWLAARRTQAEWAKDAERFRQAIALEDNAEILYAAVLNHATNEHEIRAEFDAAIAATQSTEQPKADNA